MNVLHIPCVDKGGFRQFGYKIGDMIHLGDDYNVSSGISVYAVSHGKVVFSGLVGGFGGEKIDGVRTKGGVVIIKHFDSKGRIFYGLYGHIDPHVQLLDYVEKEQLVGSVINYYCYIKKGRVCVDHLHFGIWKHASYPVSPYAYNKKVRYWVDTKKFVKNNC